MSSYFLIEITYFFFLKKKMKRAIVRSPVTGEFETAAYRISKRYIEIHFKIDKFEIVHCYYPFKVVGYRIMKIQHFLILQN
jgi:hypothetical protein